MKKAVIIICTLFILVYSAVFFTSAKDSADTVNSGKCTVTLYSDTDNSVLLERVIDKKAKNNPISSYTAPPVYGKVFTGWSDKPDGHIVLSNLSDIGEYISEETDVKLYAQWLTPYLASDEIFCFSNSSYYFDVDKDDEESAKYYLNDEDSAKMTENLYKTYFISPVSVIGSAVFSTYPEWNFRGSCYGMSVTAALQHYGEIDMLKYTDGAENLIDVQPEKDVISTINYYQYGVMVDFLCENITPKNCPQLAAGQLSSLVSEVESGKIVMFTYYDDNLLISSGHTVLITGCYTDESNNHILIVYDNRYPSDYQCSFSTRIIVSEDYSSVRFISIGENEEPVTSFHWTSDFSAFKAINKDKKSKPIYWYISFLKHIVVRLNYVLQDRDLS